MSVFRVSLNDASIRCPSVPRPGTAALILPGSALTLAMKALKSFTPRLGCTEYTAGMVTRLATGISLSGRLWPLVNTSGLMVMVLTVAMPRV